MVRALAVVGAQNSAKIQAFATQFCSVGSSSSNKCKDALLQTEHKAVLTAKASNIMSKWGWRRKFWEQR